MKNEKYIFIEKILFLGMQPMFKPILLVSTYLISIIYT